MPRQNAYQGIDLSDIPDDNGYGNIDLSDIPDATPSVTNQPPANVEPEKPWYQRAWNTVNTPLSNAPSRFAQSISNWIDPEDPIKGRSTGGIRGISSAFIEALGGIGDAATSPLSVGTAGLGTTANIAARRGLPLIADAANTAFRGSGAVTAAHGASQIVDPNATWAERAGGLAELVGGGAGAKFGAKPGVNRVNPAIAPETPPPAINPSIADLPLSQGDEIDDLIGNLGPIAGKVEQAPPASVDLVSPDYAKMDTPDEITYRTNSNPAGESSIEAVAPDGTVLGRARFTTTESGAKLEGIEVNPNHQRKGIGTQLMNELQETFPEGVIDRGDIASEAGRKFREATPLTRQVDIPAEAMIEELAPDLRGAKPRYNMGQNQYVPEFANDLDKAMFIIAQTNRSRRDADYLSYVMKQTGLNENQARTAAIELRGKLKDQLRGQTPGNVKLSKLYEAQSPTTPIVPDTEVGKGGKPPLQPPPPSSIPDPVPLSPEAEPILIRIKDKEYPEAGMIRQAWNLSRGLMAVDLPFISSAGLRQGFRYIGTKDWFKAWVPSIRAYGSDNFYKAHRKMLESDPLMKRGVQAVMRRDGTPAVSKGSRVYKETPSVVEQAGLELGDLTGHTTREEAIRSQLAEKIPGYGRHVAGSNRAYTAYINDLRLNAFRNLYEAMPDKNNIVALKQIGDAVNTFTGRGKLAVNIPESTTLFGRRVKFRDQAKEIGIEKHASLLAEALFSPRLMASRMQMLNPANYLMTQPQVRKEYLKAAVRTAGAWFTMAKIAELAGAEVVMDSNSSDFGKIKVGDKVRVDPAAGFQQFLVLMSRLKTGQVTASTTGNVRNLGEGYRPDTKLKLVQQFIENKLHPSLKYFYDALNASQGVPFAVADRTSELIIPMISKDLLEIAQENPNLLPALAPLMSGGMGTQVYGNQDDFAKPGPLGQFMDVKGIDDWVISGGGQ